MSVINEAISLLYEQGHNRRWLASKLGISDNHLSKLLGADSTISLLTVARLGQALGVKPKILLNGTTLDAGKSS